MKRTTIVLLSAAFFSLMGYAEGIKMNLQGTASVEVPHEFVDYQVTVDTRCGTADEVETQNRTQVAEVVAFLKEIVSETGLSQADNNWVRLSSSSLQEYSNFVYTNDNERREVCGGTFRVQTNISFRTTARDEAFNIVNRRYLTGIKGFVTASGARDSLTTVVTAGSAEVGICQETREATTQQAEDKAWENLLQKIYRIADKCGISEKCISIVSINPPSRRSFDESAPANAYRMLPASDGEMGPDATPVYLAPISITASWSVEALGPQTFFEGRQSQRERMMGAAE